MFFSLKNKEFPSDTKLLNVLNVSLTVQVILFKLSKITQDNRIVSVPSVKILIVMIIVIVLRKRIVSR